MAAKETLIGRVTLRNVRASYPNYFEPRAFGKGQGKPAYSGSFIIDLSTKAGQALEERIMDAIEDTKFEVFKKKDVKIKRDNLPFFYGSDEDTDLEKHPEYENALVVRARNYKRPKTYDQDGNEVDESDGLFYGGCFVTVIVTFWAQDYEGTKRVNCSLEGVKFYDDGESFGAPGVTEADFDDEDDRPSRRRKGRDDDEDDRSSRRRRDRDDDDAEERPSRRRGRDDGDSDERPSRRRGRDDADADAEDRPRRRTRDDDEEEERPRRRSREDDEGDERPSRRRTRDDDEEEERPRRRTRDDDEEEERPRRRRGRDDAV